METKELKTIPLARIFAALSNAQYLTESHRSGHFVYFFSPFAVGQKTGSMVITNKNEYLCYASGEKGDCFDLVKSLFNMDFPTSKKYICEITNNTYVNTYKPLQQEITTYTPIVASNNSSYYIKEILDFDTKFEGEYRQGENLLSYCEKRGISRNVAKHVFKKVVHGKGDKEGATYYAVGMENSKGGWELRNQYMSKGYSTPGKGVTAIMGREGSKNISVFEGMFDYASAIQYYQKIPSNHVMILHSVNFMWQLLEAIEIYELKKVFWYGDNDEAGEKAFAKIDHMAENMSKEIYPNYKDFNDFLISRL